MMHVQRTAEKSALCKFATCVVKDGYRKFVPTTLGPLRAVSRPFLEKLVNQKSVVSRHDRIFCESQSEWSIREIEVT